MAERDIYDNISAADYRYWDKDVAHYMSGNGEIRYQLKVETSLAKVFHQLGRCDESVYLEIATACSQVTTDEVYEEEDRIQHNVRALVNCIQRRVSDRAKPFVHLTATSYDIIDTANAARFHDVTQKVTIPVLLGLEKQLVDITLREAEVVQIGRTHGQHAVPITFGFGMAEYVSRLGNSIYHLDNFSDQLIGKFSGAVGAYNASSLFFDDPEEFERLALAEMGLKPADHSTQIVHAEPMTRLMSEYAICSGVNANLADDMRNLQRTEIGEVGEPFETSQVGSSTMPQKRNPTNFENVKSMWKIVMPRMITVYMDQLSDHQRDLTISASSRTYAETVAYVVSATKRLIRTMRKLQVDKANIARNFAMQGDLIAAEPLYIMLAACRYPRLKPWHFNLITNQA